MGWRTLGVRWGQLAVAWSPERARGPNAHGHKCPTNSIFMVCVWFPRKCIIPRERPQWGARGVWPQGSETLRTTHHLGTTADGCKRTSAGFWFNIDCVGTMGLVLRGWWGHPRGKYGAVLGISQESCAKFAGLGIVGAPAVPMARADGLKKIGAIWESLEISFWRTETRTQKRQAQLNCFLMFRGGGPLYPPPPTIKHPTIWGGSRGWANFGPTARPDHQVTIFFPEASL